MAHPYQAHRSHKVEKERVGHIAGRSHYARGGAVSGEEDSDTASDKAIAKDAVHKHERKLHKGQPMTKLKAGGAVEGKAPKHHLGKRAHRAAGGKVGKHHKGKTIINIHAGQPAAAGGAPMPVPMPAAPMAPPMGPPPGGPPPGLGGAPPGMRPPGMPPPGMPPMRARGGKVTGKHDGPGDKMPQDPPGWTESKRHKTPVQHTDGKGSETKDIGRGKPVTYRRGGAVKNASNAVPTTPAYGGKPTVSRTEHAVKPVGGMPKVSQPEHAGGGNFRSIPAGAKSGEGRLQKTRAAAHER